MSTPDERQRKKVFLVSPIGEEGTDVRKNADKVQRHIVKKALEPLGMDVQRADDNTNPGAITASIIASITSADLVVADLTGSNPNVFYEVAIAHGMHIPVVHMQKKGEHRPFDLKDMRTVPYDIQDLDDVEQAQRVLAEYAKAALADPDAIETPLKAAGRFKAVESSTNPEVVTQKAIMESLGEVSRRLSDIEALLAVRVTSRPRGRSLEEVRAEKESRRQGLLEDVEQQLQDLEVEVAQDKAIMQALEQRLADASQHGVESHEPDEMEFALDRARNQVASGQAAIVDLSSRAAALRGLSE
jgi:hypothetical protein